MIRWNNHYVIKLINFFEKEKKIRWFDHLIDQSIFILSHHYLILHAWTIRLRIASAYLRRFVSSILHQFVDFASSRFTVIQSKWLFSDLLIFEIVERSMNSKMNMRSWWDQIEVTTKNEDSLIRRKNLRDKRRSRFSDESRWIRKWKISK
jgi:hypothetical protein